MTLKFQKREEWFKFSDNQGNLIKRKTEIRICPVTGETSRIVFDGGLAPKAPDYTKIAEETGGAKCPFCPENVLKMTPHFPKEIAEKGRIFKGEATVFPNLFPYSKHNGVVIFSGKHYIRLEEFTVELLKDAFLAAQDYIQKIIETDPEFRYASINWNYLPYSGGSILHPHIQVIASDAATNYQKLIEEKQKAYEGDLLLALYDAEKTIGERWIGERGNVAWMHAYAPKGQNDFMAIFPQKYSISSIEEQDWENFAEGLLGVFSSLIEQGFASFNMALNVSVDEESKQSIHARLIPRFTFGMLDTSDINFFQSLHQEPLTYKAPEDIALKARMHFNKNN
ncbi:hypothetical protein KDN24_04255 [Bacillus sp. Bva_UNVM-123]|uniref:hypothetical protein n=1 Tax=Bacillus sp. Bva_UNVM-123 TaxID=2829798 RepID=UPI00391FB654